MINEKEAIKYLLSFVPDWAKEVPKGLNPTFYGTLTYKGDLEVKAMVDDIRSMVMEKVTMKEVMAGTKEEEEKFFRIMWLKGPNKDKFDRMKMKFIKKYLEKDRDSLVLANVKDDTNYT